MTGTLFVVSTPIGNMEDITLRALRVLKEAGLIAAEDTRVTKKLLTRYGISTPITSCFEHNEIKKAPYLIEKLKEGMDICLVSDAGTPGISDPGFRLVKLAVENAIKVVPIPGPSALTAVLSVSGLPLDEFIFKGFIPAGKSDRKRFLLGLKTPRHTFAMYESARRIKDTLKDIMEILGDVEIVLAREMTKIHEEVMRDRVSAIIGALKDRDLKGEIALVVRTADISEISALNPAEEIEKLFKSGFGLKDVVKAVAEEFGLPKKEVYREALRIKAALNL